MHSAPSVHRGRCAKHDLLSTEPVYNIVARRGSNVAVPGVCGWKVLRKPMLWSTAGRTGVQSGCVGLESFRVDRVWPCWVV